MDAVNEIIEQLANPWILLGFFGQFIFFMRFVVQWIASERKQAIVIPAIFWYFSIGGALITLVYSIHQRDIVFISAQSLSLIIYVRNLILERRSAKTQLTTTTESQRPI